MNHYAPYAIFCLMPVFALFLKVLYLGSGRRFGEHMLFALHTNAFAFLMFSVILLAHFGLLQFAVVLADRLPAVGHAARVPQQPLRHLPALVGADAVLRDLTLGLAVMISAGMGILTVG
jgi:membrane-anchored protein YejM (alkaline phosphatase superfamily)